MVTKPRSADRICRKSCSRLTKALDQSAALPEFAGSEQLYDGYRVGEPTGTNIDLCSGAGGLALGLAQAGFSFFDFYDNDKGACDTLRYNLNGDGSTLIGRVFQGDLLSTEWIPNASDVRLLGVGAPCQPFSMGGNHKGAEDQRNLFPIVLKAVRALRPRAVLIENVRGLERKTHARYLEYILRQLSWPDIEPAPEESWTEHDHRLQQHSRAGKRPPDYRVSWKILNAADFGIPQIRHRLFVLATQSDLPEFSFPIPTHSKQKLMAEQTSGAYWEVRNLPVSPASQTSCGPDDWAQDKLPWVTVRDKISDLPPPADADDPHCNNHWRIPGARSYVGHTGSRMDWPSKTLKAGVHGVPGGENTVIDDDGVLRYYTLREMARIQTFADEHYFVGARSNVTRQIGNAVPCELAAVVAKPLAKLLRGVVPQLR